MTIKANALQFIQTRFHPLATIRKTPWLHQALAKIDFPIFFLDPVTNIRIAAYWYRDLPYILDSSIQEREVQKAFIDVLQAISIQVFWDIGAHIGYYTWLVNSIKPNIKSLMIEPFPVNANLLNKTIKKNRFNNVKLLQCAISNHCGSTSFMVDTFSGAASQLKEIYVNNHDYDVASIYGLTDEITVNTKTLDSLIKTGETMPDLIKVDIERAEGMLYEGAEKLICQRKAIFIMEVFQRGHEVLQKFKSTGYDIFKLDDSNYLIIPSNKRDEATSIYEEYASKSFDNF